MKLSKLFHEKYFILLGACILVSSIIALYTSLFQTRFGFDMSRDAYEAYQIYHDHNIKIMGPGTDIVGLNHGVLWYYLLAIPYLMSHEDPQVAFFFFFILSFATVPFVWILSQMLFKNKTVSFVATVMYCFSSFVMLLSSWMSNPVLALYVTPPLLVLLWSYCEKQNIRKAFLIGILFGIIIQAQLANILLLITIPLFYLFLKIKIKFKEIIFILLGLVLSLSSYIITEIKFKGRGILGIMDFFKSHHGAAPNPLRIADKIIDFFNITFFPFYEIFVVVIVLSLLILTIKYFKTSKKPLTFLLVWLSNILIFTFFNTGVTTSYFVFIPSIVAGVILVSFLFTKFIKNKILLGFIVLIFIFTQLIAVINWQKEEYSPTAIQRSNTVYRYKQVVDYTYKSSNGKPFTINTVTIPLFINTTWSYLYEFYGKDKYGYMPFWGGKSQIGYLGNLPVSTDETDIRYLIIESPIGIPDVYIAKAKYDEDRKSDLTESKNFGAVIVEKRALHKDKKNVSIPKELINSPVLYE